MPAWTQGWRLVTAPWALLWAECPCDSPRGQGWQPARENVLLIEAVEQEPWAARCGSAEFLDRQTSELSPVCLGETRNKLVSEGEESTDAAARPARLWASLALLGSISATITEVLVLEKPFQLL